MNIVLQGVPSEDMIQLFEPLPSLPGTPVIGLAHTDVKVSIRKSNATGYTVKTLTAPDWVDRGGGNYSIQFTGSDFDTLGSFRYRVEPLNILLPFITYEDFLYIDDELPSSNQDLPTITSVSPDPVARGATLTINGTNLESVYVVTLAGIPATITSQTTNQIQVTVPIGTPLGDVEIIAENLAGQATSTVEVVLAAADIPGSGMINLYGYIHNPSNGQPYAGIGVKARMLDRPNLKMGVAWTEDLVSATTNSNGRFDFYMPRDVRIEVMISQIRYRRVFQTPDVASANIFTEIP